MSRREAAFSLNGSLTELQRLEAEVTGFCREHSLADEAAFDLNLILEELFTNALRHGGCAGLENAVQIHLERDGGNVWVEFSDRGPAFDPLSAPAPDLESPLEDRLPGGLGVHLVRQTIGSLDYRRVGEWNRITMRKSI
jgi:serine/threonine-protein kinase RsbW